MNTTDDTIKGTGNRWNSFNADDIKAAPATGQSAEEASTPEAQAKQWDDAGYHGAAFKDDDYDYDKVEDAKDSDPLRASFVKAAKHLYSMKFDPSDPENKDLFDAKGEPKLSNDELVAFAKTQMRWFNQNSVGLTRWALRLNDDATTDDQKKAFGYLMDLHSHSNTDIGDFGSFLVKGILTDPTTLIGIGTLGAGTVVAQGGKLAAKEGIKAVIKQSLKQSVKTTLTHTIKKSIQYGTAQVAKNGIKKGTLQGLKFFGKSSWKRGGAFAVEGALHGTYFDAAMQHSKIAMGQQEKFSYGQSAFSFGLGLVAGEAMSFGLNTAGRTIKPFAGDTYKWAKTGVQNFSANYKSGVAARHADANLATAGVSWKSIKAPFQKWANKKTAKAATPKTPIAPPHLPTFKPKVDWMKVWMRRTSNPLKLFTNWAPVTNMNMESRKITAPVINAVDKLMGNVESNGKISSASILKKAQKLQDDILDAVDSGGDPKKIIDKFSADNATELQSLHTKIGELKKHVTSTYITVEDKGKNWGLKNLPHAIYAGQYIKTGITNKQKMALLSFLDEVENMAVDLQQGVKGNHGKQMLQSVKQIKAKTFTTDNFRNSATGLSRLQYLADMADTRITGNWRRHTDDPKFEAKAKKAHLQWKASVERSIQDGYYNKVHHQTPIPLSIVKSENIERQWQNQILPFYKNIGKVDDNGIVTSVSWDVQNVPTFAAMLKETFDSGLDHDVPYMIDDLARRRQTVGQSELYTIPSPDMLKNAFKDLGDYGNDLRYTKWVDDVTQQVREEHQLAKGAYRAITGPFQHNRPNMQEYAMKSYPYRFSTRYAYTGALAVPGRNYWTNRLVLTPIKQAGAWLAGAKKSGIIINAEKVEASPDIAWKGEGGKWYSVPRRSFVRIASAGLLDDFHGFKMGKDGAKTSMIPIPRPSKLGWWAVGGGTVWGLGKLTGISPLENAGGWFAENTTEPLQYIWGTDFDPENQVEYKLIDNPHKELKHAKNLSEDLIEKKQEAVLRRDEANKNSDDTVLQDMALQAEEKLINASQNAAEYIEKIQNALSSLDDTITEQDRIIAAAPEKTKIAEKNLESAKSALKNAQQELAKAKRAKNQKQIEMREDTVDTAKENLQDRQDALEKVKIAKEDAITTKATTEEKLSILKTELKNVSPELIAILNALDPAEAGELLKNSPDFSKVIKDDAGLNNVLAVVAKSEVEIKAEVETKDSDGAKVGDNENDEVVGVTPAGVTTNDDGEPRSVAKAANRFFDTWLNPDEFGPAVGNTIKDTGTLLSGAFHGAKDLAGDTFKNLKSTDGGRLALGVGGGLLSSWLGMSLIGGWIDKSFISKVPLLGGAIKLLVGVGIFLAGMKGTGKLLQGKGDFIETNLVTLDDVKPEAANNAADESDEGKASSGDTGGLEKKVSSVDKTEQFKNNLVVENIQVTDAEEDNVLVFEAQSHDGKENGLLIKSANDATIIDMTSNHDGTIAHVGGAKFLPNNLPSTDATIGTGTKNSPRDLIKQDAKAITVNIESLSHHVERGANEDHELKLIQHNSGLTPTTPAPDLGQSLNA